MPARPLLARSPLPAVGHVLLRLARFVGLGNDTVLLGSFGLCDEWGWRRLPS
ncbi:MAG: hypothetical protein ACRDP8_18655 [Actinopolymorphaceae bacterium]